jgi:predicted transcriptional regulator
MEEKTDVIGLTTEIISSYLPNNAMQADAIPNLIK